MYVTKSGQMWDEIAFEVYGDCRYVENLYAANRDKLKFFVFPAGIELELPEVETETAKIKVPSWRLEQ